MDMLLWGWGLGLFVYAFVCAGLSADLADKKGYRVGVYFAVGFFFGILGLIAAAGLPPSRLQAEIDGREYEKQRRKQIVEDAQRASRKKRTVTVEELLEGDRGERKRTGQ